MVAMSSLVVSHCGISTITSSTDHADPQCGTTSAIGSGGIRLALPRITLWIRGGDAGVGASEMNKFGA